MKHFLFTLILFTTIFSAIIVLSSCSTNEDTDVSLVNNNDEDNGENNGQNNDSLPTLTEKVSSIEKDNGQNNDSLPILTEKVSSIEKDNGQNNDSLPILTEKVSSIEKEGVIMTYCLLNLKGDTTVTFSVGEEIIFDLTIENASNRIVPKQWGPGALGYNTFRVYTTEGKDCGVSWSYIQDWTYEMAYLWSLTTYHYQCPWYRDDVIKATAPFVFKPTSKELAHGSYYTESFCHLKDGTTLYCKLYFNIE